MTIDRVFAGHMVSSESLSRRLGGLYCLYCLYETQPFKPPYRIYLSLGKIFCDHIDFAFGVS